MYWKVDMSFVKRFQLPRRMVVEARMDLFNVFDTINFNGERPDRDRQLDTGLAARSRAAGR